MLVPEHPINLEPGGRTGQGIYDLQKNVVIVCGEGIVDERESSGRGDHSTDPAGNIILTGASEALRKADPELGDGYFQRTAGLLRSGGHLHSKGRPHPARRSAILFDRFYAAQLGGKAVEMLLKARTTRSRSCSGGTKGFHVDSYNATLPRPLGPHHARRMHASFYDPQAMQPSRLGIEYLLPIFTDAIGHDDVEHMRQTLFDAGNLSRRTTR